MKKITVFTPTYNRGSKLPVLYKSLVDQSCQDFIWLIVDDGSTDETETIVNKWLSDGEIEIEYIKQENKGKSFAHNVGVENTFTELFVCVDSDDYLDKFAIECVLKHWETRIDGDIGILAKRSVTCQKKELDNQSIHTTLRDASKKYGIYGDTMLVYKTNIIQKYKFPSFKNEKFVPENYLYDLLDRDGTLYYLNKVLYYGSYCDDGYTRNMAKTIKHNSTGYLAYITQRISLDHSLFDRYTDLIRYVAINLARRDYRFLFKSGHPLLCFFAIPTGFALYWSRYKDV